MFAERYLKKNETPVLIPVEPDKNTGIIVVIPCLNESDILQTLNSLNSCILPKTGIEVIILVNHSETAPENIREQNLKTIFEIEEWNSENQKSGLKFYAAGPVELRKKWAGAGLARKWGMDEALRRFSLLDRPEGVIVSLDADTLVEQNYFTEIEKYFLKNQEDVGVTIAFTHQTEGLDKKHLEGIKLYEKYMVYYKNALEFTGYPYPMFTVGSAFAVRADAYLRRGGMNRRKAGEDFYFLQNLVQLGKVGELKITMVYPSARLSDRVPFGTGPVLRKWMSGDEDLTKTYNFQAFLHLKEFFDLKNRLFQISETEYLKVIENLPAAVTTFLKEDNFWKEIADLNKNCSSSITFQQRFFQKFNAFKILKFLNFSHGTFYHKADIAVQFRMLSDNKNI